MVDATLGLDPSSEEFLLGTATGLVSSALVWLLRNTLGGMLGLVQALAMPKGSVQSPWDATYWKNGKAVEEQVQLKQFMHFVWGVITDKANGPSYAVRGTLRDRVLVATYAIKGHSAALDRGTFTLRLADSGEKMEGSYSWIEAGQPIPKSGRYLWTRRKV